VRNKTYLAKNHWITVKNHWITRSAQKSLDPVQNL